MNQTARQLVGRINECLNRTELAAVGETIAAATGLSEDDTRALRRRYAERREEIAKLFAEWQQRQGNH